MFSLESLLRDVHTRASEVPSESSLCQFNTTSSVHGSPLSVYRASDDYHNNDDVIYQSAHNNVSPSGQSDVSHNEENGSRYITESVVFHSDSSSSDSGLESADTSSVSGDSTSSSPPQLSSKPVTHSKKTDRKPLRVCYTDQQLQRLERLFLENPYPDVDLMERLSEELDIPEKKLRIWFQNKRARTRRRLQAYGPTPFMPSTLLSALAAGYPASNKVASEQIPSTIPLQDYSIFQQHSPRVPFTTRTPSSASLPMQMTNQASHGNPLNTAGFYSSYFSSKGSPSGHQTMGQLLPKSATNTRHQVIPSVNKSPPDTPVTSSSHCDTHFLTSRHNTVQMLPFPQYYNSQSSYMSLPIAQTQSMPRNPLFPSQSQHLSNSPIFSSHYQDMSYYPFM